MRRRTVRKTWIAARLGFNLCCALRSISYKWIRRKTGRSIAERIRTLLVDHGSWPSSATVWKVCDAAEVAVGLRLRGWRVPSHTDCSVSARERRRTSADCSPSVGAAAAALSSARRRSVRARSAAVPARDRTRSGRHVSATGARRLPVASTEWRRRTRSDRRVRRDSGVYGVSRD